jgi:hypothetical protein
VTIEYELKKALEESRLDGEMAAYERVADRLTLGLFCMPLGVEVGDQACVIARRIVYELRDERQLYRKFRSLRDVWRSATSHLSFGREEHWAYQRIIEMGKPIVPYLLAELRDDPDHWSFALMKITGECPDIPEEHRGRLHEVAKDWLRWAEERGIKPREKDA